MRGKTPITTRNYTTQHSHWDQKHITGTKKERKTQNVSNMHKPYKAQRTGGQPKIYPSKGKTENNTHTQARSQHVKQTNKQILTCAWGVGTGVATLTPGGCPVHADH